MSFPAFGRGREQDGAHSHPSHRNGNSNGQGHSNGNPNGNGSHHSHSPPNGNGIKAGNGIPFFRATLSSGVSIKGTVKFRSELVIDGNVEGTIDSLGRLTVGRNGHVRGDIKTRSVTVEGTVDGNLSVGEKCELRSGCTLRGDIETSRLVMEENVNFTGSAQIATPDYLAELRPINGNRQK